MEPTNCSHPIGLVLSSTTIYIWYYCSVVVFIIRAFYMSVYDINVCNENLRRQCISSIADTWLVGRYWIRKLTPCWWNDMINACVNPWSSVCVGVWVGVWVGGRECGWVGVCACVCVGWWVCVCACVCVHVHMCVHIHVTISHIYTYTHKYKCACRHARTYGGVCMRGCVLACVFVHVLVYACVCVFVIVCVCVLVTKVRAPKWVPRSATFSTRNSTPVYIYIYIHSHVYMWMCTYMYIYMYIYI